MAALFYLQPYILVIQWLLDISSGRVSESIIEIESPLSITGSRDCEEAGS
ncbi:MAG: hypothetical protein IPF91_13865 [Saprospiraceae bacterium]|nr:hypothetical protein [Candidatus Brachybacter algidus]